MTPALDITTAQRKTLLTLLRRFIPGVIVWAYGSRVKWTARPNSDLDLVAFTTPAQSPLVSELKEALAESNLPFPVDLHVWDEVPERFHEIIRKEYVVLQEAGLPKESKWPSIRLGNVCRKIGSGATPRGGGDTYLESGPFSLIRSQNVYNNRFTNDGLAFISKEQADDLSNVEVSVGDVLLNITGDSVARCCQAPKEVLPARVNQHVAIIRPEPSQLDATFLRYFLVSPQMQEQMLTLSGAGATRNALTKGMIENFDVPKPDITEQHAIASVLGALDDKIELNRRMNETLEALAQTLFKSWFVAATQSALPKGWREGKLSDIADIVMGLSPDGDSYNTEGTGIPLINGPVEFGDYFPVKSKWTTSPTRMAQAGDLIFCVRGSTTGRRVVADDAYCLGRGVCGMRAKSGANAFLYQAVNLGLESLLAKTTGSVFPSLSAPDIKGFSIVLPPDEIIAQFSKNAEPLVERIQANVRESRTLAALRDALLPKLLSGELRVPAKLASLDL